MTETGIPKLSSFITPTNIARFVVGTSARFVVTATIASLVPAETKLERAKLAVGSYVIASLVADKAKDYIENEIGEITDVFKKLSKQKDNEPEIDIPNP